jgi:hypothetical protein
MRFYFDGSNHIAFLLPSSTVLFSKKAGEINDFNVNKFWALLNALPLFLCPKIEKQ